MFFNIYVIEEYLFLILIIGYGNVRKKILLVEYLKFILKYMELFGLWVMVLKFIIKFIGNVYFIFLCFLKL